MRCLWLHGQMFTEYIFNVFSKTVLKFILFYFLFSFLKKELYQPIELGKNHLIELKRKKELYRPVLNLAVDVASKVPIISPLYLNLTHQQFNFLLSNFIKSPCLHFIEYLLTKIFGVIIILR